MNEYYIAHGGPGSGRYPLGSGERPYQKFEGSGKRRFGGISGYIKSRKAKKAEEKEKNGPIDERKRLMEEAQKKKQFEADKERVLREGSATDVMRYQGHLTNQELQSAYNRLNLESQIRSLSQKEMQSNMDKLNKIVGNVKVGKEILGLGKDLYNLAAEAYNATPDGQKKPLNLIGKETPESKRNEERRYKDADERRKEERHRLEMEKIRGMNLS